jgi:hypothetical protein
MFDYFPEPFLCLGNEEDLKLIFLNINPGGGGPSQHFKTREPRYLYDFYEKNDNSYHETIKQYLGTKKLSNDEENMTSRWFNNRVKWSQEIFDESDINANNVLCADLVPWHTRKESEISGYINENYLTIFRYVILPLIKIALKIDSDNPVILVRGVAFFDVINSWLRSRKDKLKQEINNCKEEGNKEKLKSKTDELKKFNLRLKNEKSAIEQFIVFDDRDKFFDKFNSYLAKYKFTHREKTVTFYIFSGGANMDFPKATHRVIPIIGKKEMPVTTLKDFFKSENFGVKNQKFIED